MTKVFIKPITKYKLTPLIEEDPRYGAGMYFPRDIFLRSASESNSQEVVDKHFNGILTQFGIGSRKCSDGIGFAPVYGVVPQFKL